MDPEASETARGSSNFEFLAAREPRLYLSGIYAEDHLYLDPNASMVHSRQFGEQLAKSLWAESGHDGTHDTQYQRIQALREHGVISEAVCDLFTDVRRIGNRAVHDQWDNKADALSLLHACYELGRWFHHTTTGGLAPSFVPPALSGNTRHSSAPVPRQLPPRQPTFAGRRHELAQLDGLRETSPQPGTAVVAAIVGTAGVGKTTLALHWAHEVERHFPDGQLYVDLRGFDPGEPVAVAQALHGLLQALGVPAAGIPSDTAARTEVYRSLVADRRMLIVLDNARSSVDVTQLLPNAATCMVIVTSRDRLHGLVVRNGAVRVELTHMSTEDSIELLIQRLTRERVEAEPEAAEDLAAACAHLPLALSIAGASHPDLPLRDLVKRLRDHAKLDALDLGVDDLNVRAVFSWSYDQLPAEAARLFRQLGVHPGPDFDTCVCAALLGNTRLGDARAVLTKLANANLIEEHRPDRFRCHVLLRSYAAELADDTERLDAETRMIRYYVNASRMVNSRIQPCWDERGHEWSIAHNYPQVTNQADAMAWFAAEQATLRAVIELAGQRGHGMLVGEIARGCTVYLARTGQRHERVALHRMMLTVTRDSGHLPAVIASLRELARALMRLGELDETIGYLDEALDLVKRWGDDNDEIAIHLNYSLALCLRGQHLSALHHARVAEQITRGSRDLRYQAGTCTAVARQLACVGEYAAALSLCEEGRDQYAQVHNPGGEAQALSILGFIHQKLGRDDAAIACYEQALELDRHINARYWEAVVLERLSDRYEAVGRTDRARDARQQAKAILTSLAPQQ